MANGGESFDQMIARVQARRESAMPFKPFTASADAAVAPAAKLGGGDKKNKKPFGKKGGFQKGGGKSFGGAKNMRGGGRF
jgi:hypothetical protein